MAILVETQTKGEYLFDCPGCGNCHSITTKSKNSQGAQWTFNENLINPTFSPSLLVRWDNNICHSFIKDGMMQFLGDCTHENKNKTLKIQEFN